MYTDGVEPAFAINVPFCGGSGTGKSTGMDSFRTVDSSNSQRIENQEDRMDEDLPRRTVGMPIHVFELGGLTMILKDLAGQEDFSATHDLFNASNLPELPLVFLNGFLDISKLVETAKYSLGRVVSRHKSSGRTGEEFGLVEQFNGDPVFCSTPYRVTQDSRLIHLKN